MNTSTIVQKLWNYCNVLRDAGPLSHLATKLAQAVVPRVPEFTDPQASAPRSHPRLAGPLLHAPHRKHSYGDYVEQLTYLLFGSGITSPFARCEPTPQQAGRPACCLKMADERTKAPYNQKSPVPEQYGWPPSPRPSPASGRGGFSCDGDELFDHYRHTHESLGNQKGLLGQIFNKSQNKFDSHRFVAALTLWGP